jgi:outer membrane protein
MSQVKRFLASTVLASLAVYADAAELIVEVSNVPASGQLVFQVYDSANAFGDFRDPASETVVESKGDGEYRLLQVPSGDIAVLVYVDANRNGIIDKNFIGIPRETLGLSNNYRPKGPPSFDRARFMVGEDDARKIEIELYKVLGKRGRLGVGAGVVGRSSPYMDSSGGVFQPIPAITYNGERLQWLGPTLRYGIVGSGKLRLALSASYRIGVYEEDDSPVLTGLGDRDDTLLAGLGLQYELPGGFDASLRYEHDVLDRIGGGAATASLSKGFQLGFVRLSPKLVVNWQSSELANHDFGVPLSAATPVRPAYSPGSTASAEIGLTSFIEITEDWRILFDLSLERLDDAVVDSPHCGTSASTAHRHPSHRDARSSGASGRPAPDGAS